MEGPEKDWKSICVYLVEKYSKNRGFFPNDVCKKFDHYTAIYSWWEQRSVALLTVNTYVYGQERQEAHDEFRSIEKGTPLPPKDTFMFQEPSDQEWVAMCYDVITTLLRGYTKLTNVTAKFAAEKEKNPSTAKIDIAWLTLNPFVRQEDIYVSHEMLDKRIVEKFKKPQSTSWTAQDEANYAVMDALLAGFKHADSLRATLRKRYDDKIRISVEEFLELSNIFFHSEGQMNALVEAARSRNPSKNMTATQLLTQSTDVELKALVETLMLRFRKDEAWYRFLANKGATSTQAAQDRINEARETGEPARFLIPEFCRMPNYMALEFLEDCRAVPTVAKKAAAILLHLAERESAAQTNAEANIRLNTEIRRFIMDNQLMSDLSIPSVSARLDALKSYGVTSLADLRRMDEDKFAKCGFDGLYATKAVLAAQGLKY